MQSAPQELDYFEPSSDYRQSLLSSKASSLQSSATPVDGTKPHKNSHSRWSSMSWKWQILGWVSSLCFFIAIVLVLRIWDGRPLPDLRFGITPNAIIGLLATFMELLLLAPVHSAFGQLKWLRALRKGPMDDFRTIDEASRGPWGSMLLLFRRAGGSIGSFGAFVTITSLGISTFSQQALRYTTIYPFSGDALMPTAQFTNGTGSAHIGNGVFLDLVDEELLTAPYMAFFGNPKASSTVSAHCGTGNCTWESYQTLSFCSTCADLTSSLTMTKVKNKDDYTNYYTLPNGFGLTGNNLPAAALLNITTTRPNQRSMKLDDWQSIAFAKNGSKLMSVFAVGPSPGTFPVQPDAKKTFDPMTGPKFAPPIAYECMLQLCVRNMRAEFNEGVLKESIVSTWTDESQFHYPSPHDDMTLKPPGSKTTFFATGEAASGMHSWLTYLLVGNASTESKSGHWDLTSAPGATSEFIRRIHLSMNSTVLGFPNLMENLANSLSLNLRSVQYQPPPVKGQAFTSTSHAVVTWPWLILPAFELIGSLVFLVIVMIQTKRNGLSAWSNNPLAYFFHGLDERPHRQHIYESQVAMETEARKLLVEFQTHEDSKHLVIVEK